MNRVHQPQYMGVDRLHHLSRNPLLFQLILEKFQDIAYKG